MIPSRSSLDWVVETLTEEDAHYDELTQRMALLGRGVCIWVCFALQAAAMHLKGTRVPFAITKFDDEAELLDKCPSE